MCDVKNIVEAMVAPCFADRLGFGGGCGRRKSHFVVPACLPACLACCIASVHKNQGFVAGMTIRLGYVGYMRPARLAQLDRPGRLGTEHDAHLLAYLPACLRGVCVVFDWGSQRWGITFSDTSTHAL